MHFMHFIFTEIYNRMFYVKDIFIYNRYPDI